MKVLTLELDLHSHIDTANIETLLQNAHWPNLRVLRLRGVNCRVPELVRFLTAHPTLEELALAQMMPGHAWTQLEIPPDALPNLRHLECSSAQAAALLKNASAWPLETLLGVELHDRVVLATYFSWDEDWEEEDHEDENVEVPSPWKSLLLDRIKAQSSVICLGIVHVDESQEVEALSRIAPQLRELDICARRDIDVGISLRSRASHVLLITPAFSPLRAPSGTDYMHCSQPSKSFAPHI